MLSLAIFLIAVVILPLVWGMATYNRLVALRNRFKNAFAQIDVQLKRRYDLIPNLVETAKGYMAHEASTLEAVIAARNGAVGANIVAASDPGNAAAIGQLNQAEATLKSSLGRLFALSESYPDLKANTTLGQLMEELGSTENKIAFARQAFNDSVMSYNTKVEQFPANVLAGMFRFAPTELLVATESAVERQAVQVKF